MDTKSGNGPSDAPGTTALYQATITLPRGDSDMAFGTAAAGGGWRLTPADSGFVRGVPESAPCS